MHFSCGLFLVPVCFRNNAKASPCFSQKAEIGHGPGEDPYEDGRLRFALEVSVCVFRFLGKFKVWFWKLRIADMLDKRIQTLDPEAQKHDQSRTQIDIKAKMIYNSKTKCFPLGPKMYQNFYVC